MKYYIYVILDIDILYIHSKTACQVCVSSLSLGCEGCSEHAVTCAVGLHSSVTALLIAEWVQIEI